MNRNHLLSPRRILPFNSLSKYRHSFPPTYLLNKVLTFQLEPTDLVYAMKTSRSEVASLRKDLKDLKDKLKEKEEVIEDRNEQLAAIQVSFMTMVRLLS